MKKGNPHIAYGNEPIAVPDLEDVNRAWAIPREGLPTYSPYVGVGSDWLVRDCAGEEQGAPWYWYLISVIHLRDMPGMPSPVRWNTEVTHEVTFMALSPDKALPDLDCWRYPMYLLPPDFVHQFTVRGDEQAKILGDALIEHICEGRSPFEANQPYWWSLVEHTAEHLTYGTHPSWN